MHLCAWHYHSAMVAVRYQSIRLITAYSALFTIHGLGYVSMVVNYKKYFSTRICLYSLTVSVDGLQAADISMVKPSKHLRNSKTTNF